MADRQPPASGRLAVVALDGPLGVDPAIADLIAGADLIVAADGGADRLGDSGQVPDLVVGDLDSLDPDRAEQLAAAGIPIQRHPRDKDLIDGELALQAALQSRPDRVVLLGLLGGTRPDMVLANQMLLFHPQLAPVTATAMVPGWTIFPVGQDLLELAAAPGKILSLVPIDATAEGVEISGVRWPLSEAVLRRGQGRTLSNRVAEDRIRVRCRSGRALLYMER